jgi:hypothetical protein
MKAIMAACWIKPQKMIAQQGQFFVLAERPYGTSGTRRTDKTSVVHVKLLSGSPRGGVASLALQLHLIEGSESMGDHDSGFDDWWSVG